MNRLSEDPGANTPRKPNPSALQEGESCLTPAAASAMLDEELEQSFPASDPPSLVQAPLNICKDPAQEDRERAERLEALRSSEAQEKAQGTSQEKAHESDLLDEALEESFPASDPPAPAQPHLPEEDDTNGDGPPGQG